MPISCNVCDGKVADSPDSLVLCIHKQGMVHLGCCVHNCSLNKEPCEHAKAFYDRVDLEK